MIIKFKKSQLKSIGLILLTLFLFSYLIYATVTTTLNDPANAAWIKKFPMNFTGVCSGNSSAEVGYNVTLYHNVSGTWRANYTIKNLADAVTQNFTEVNTIADGNNVVWNIECKNNLTGESTFGTNITFKIDTTAPTAPVIDLPKNGSYIIDLTPFINWTISTEANFKQYKIQFANDSDFDTVDILKEQLLTSQTANQTNFTSALDDNKLWYLRVLAEDLAGNTAWQFINVTTTTTTPAISIVNFADATYQSDNTPTFQITATHQFLYGCELYLTNVSNSSNLATSFNVNQTLWVLNRTNATRANGTLQFTPTTMADGIFKFGFVCNSSSGVSSGFTTNRSITIDTTSPTAFGCFAPANNTKSIDHTPELSWNESIDINFGNYTVTIDNNSDFSSPEETLYYSTQSDTTSAKNLRAYNSKDRNWYWRVNSSDLAGNTRVTTNCSDFYYRTDVTNHLLDSGWNIVAIMQSGNINASTLGSGLGANWITISRYNASKNFQNYNNGSSTNANMNFKKGDVMFVNVNNDTYWENQTWDTNSNYNNGGFFNLTNITNDWNVFGIQNQSGRTIGNIERLIVKSNSYATVGADIAIIPMDNASLQTIVYFNNTAITTRKFVPHPNNYSFNNNTLVDFGEAVWININKTWNASTPLGLVGYVTLNQTLI